LNPTDRIDNVVVIVKRLSYNVNNEDVTSTK
jgi:hypothetical protein